MTLSDERTLCQHCGLTTRTAADGVCVECWEDKSRRSVYAPGKKPPGERPHPQSDPGFFGYVITDLFDDLLPWP